MTIIDTLSNANGILDQLISIVPKTIAFAAIAATLVPESTPIVGAFLHKIALNIGKAANK
jgi:hypothetical protein